MNLAYIKDREIVISGFNGFIGRYLLEKIYGNKFEVICLDDVGNYNVKFFIHLASKVTSLKDSLTNNLKIDLDVLSVCEEKKYCLIYASGNNVYPFKKNCDLSTPLKINDYYSASKIFTENLITDLYNVNAYILRIADVFGLGQRQGNFFKSIYESVLNNKEITIYGKGSKIRSYIYVKDLVNLLDYLGSEKNKETYGIYNVNYSKSYSLNDIANFIAKEKNLKIKYNNLDKEDLSERTMLPSIFNNFKYQYDMDSSLVDLIKELENV
jgi:nucleoside-diphosphate-sugar epimerase